MQEIIGFYGLKDEYSYFSNWYSSKFEVDGQTFGSSEQYMMYRKAMVFGDVDTAHRILASNNQGEIKRLGRLVKNYNDVIWSGIRQIEVYRGLLEKFRQNEDIKSKLLDTENSILCECSPTDTIWGIGLPLSDNRYEDIRNWRGKNLLGFTLMEVRSRIK